MLQGYINNPATYGAFSSPTLATAFMWIQRAIREKLEPREEPYPIQGDGDIFAIIQEKNTCLFKDRKIESHREYIDLQFCWEDGEDIYCWDSTPLTTAEAYDTENDHTYHGSANALGYNLTRMRPGAFVIFLPGEAHKPLVDDGVNRKVKKIVIKIRRKLLPESFSALSP